MGFIESDAAFFGNLNFYFITTVLLFIESS